MKEIFWCKNCLNMSTRPRITFDSRNWCNACQWTEEKTTMDWRPREKELIQLLDLVKMDIFIDPYKINPSSTTIFCPFTYLLKSLKR